VSEPHVLSTQVCTNNGICRGMCVCVPQKECMCCAHINFSQSLHSCFFSSLGSSENASAT
jgi:hypothetical protein